MKIIFIDELPQWITSSDTAAYHPFSKTIWIKRGLGFNVIPVLFHQMLHFFIDVMFSDKIATKLHLIIDSK